VTEPDPQWRGDKSEPSTSQTPCRIYNIGSNSPVDLLRYIEVLEDCLCKKAEKNMVTLQSGDVPDTLR